MTKINQTIYKLLINNSFPHIVENRTIWKYFKKSDYYKYLREDIIKYKGYDLDESVKLYAEKFCESTGHLNLF